jgi:hypothetical protein
MKKTFIAITAALFLATSCTDSLDILPNDSIVSESAFTTVSDLQVGMNAVYQEYNPDNIIDFSSIFTDDTKIGADNGGQKVALHNQTINPGSGDIDDIWLSNYRMINSINRLISAAGSITPADATEQATYDKILGDCYALRALAHFELVQFYSTSYDAAAEGVPYVDYVGVFEQPARNTVGEVFTAIDTDLASAEALIDPAFSDNGYVTVDFINALRARKALYAGDYPNAITYSQMLINNYTLANQSEYAQMYQDTDNTEVIFKHLRVTQNDAFIGGTWFFTGTGGSFIEMSNGLYNQLDPSDVRTSVVFDAATSDPANNLHNIGKYLGKNGFNYLNDVKVFRVSEMYLINAEAKALLSNDFAGAAAMVQAVRDARFNITGAAPNYTTTLEAMTDILAERRIELAFEGHRFLDLKRTRSITNLGIVRDALDCGGATPCTLPVNDDRFTLPIPDDELNGNNNMTQNPGY